MRETQSSEVIIVCGGRDYENYGYLSRVLDLLHSKIGIKELHHGDARGADRLAGHWARENGIPEIRHPADWKRDGRAAGPIRNERMLKAAKPTRVIAFPGGNGTAHM